MAKKKQKMTHFEIGVVILLWTIGFLMLINTIFGILYSLGNIYP